MVTEEEASKAAEEATEVRIALLIAFQSLMVSGMQPVIAFQSLMVSGMQPAALASRFCAK